MFLNFVYDDYNTNVIGNIFNSCSSLFLDKEVTLYRKCTQQWSLFLYLATFPSIPTAIMINISSQIYQVHAQVHKKPVILTST